MLVSEPGPDECLVSLIAVGREAVDHGLVLAAGGNLSLRTETGFLITPTGAWLDRLTAESFVAVPLADPPVRKESGASSEWRMHQAVYASRPDCRCILHLHPQMSVLLDALGEEIRIVTLDHAFYARRRARVPYLPSGSRELSNAVGDAARYADVVVLAHHGCVALARSPDEAFQLLLNVEEAAVLTYRLLLLGRADVAFPAGALDSLTP